jgi:hypothetical protein
LIYIKYQAGLNKCGASYTLTFAVEPAKLKFRPRKREMNTIETHVVNGFTYRVDAAQEIDGRHRGQIFILYCEDTGEFFIPPKIIRTPAAFKTSRAAIIEAESYSYEILMNGNPDGVLAVAEPNAI